MFSTLALIAAAIAPTPAAPAAAAAAPVSPRGALTATYHFKTGDYCIRSGWRAASSGTRHVVRRGDCRSAAQWASRGLAFEAVETAPAANRSLAVAAR